MDLFLYNSLTRKKEKFTPLNPPNVNLYTCGPTVYDFAHIGNLRTYVFNDVLHKTLLYNGYKVKRVMNVTDVGHLTGDRDMGMDKVETASKEKGLDAWELTKFYLDAFEKDMKRLNMLEPTIWEKATDTIPEQIALIKTLEERNYTYKISDGVYFDTSKFPEYGKMSSLDKEGMKEASRVDYNPERKNPSDFALWKFNTTGEKRQMEWDSPWGIGFPGWHIECSAIALKHLGATFDIHTGAIDHKEIHHPNEMAQTECATGKRMANFWMHAGFLNTSSEDKMSKSKGNFITLETLIDKGYDPLSFRYYTFGIHYRQTTNFSLEALSGAQVAFNKLKTFMAIPPEEKSIEDKAKTYDDKFLSAINNDLNMPEATSLIWILLKDETISEYEKRTLLLKWDAVLGLSLDAENKAVLEIPEDIEKLRELREELRKNKKFDEADTLRKELEKRGYKVVDTKENSEIVPL